MLRTWDQKDMEDYMDFKAKLALDLDPDVNISNKLGELIKLWNKKGDEVFED